MAQMNRNVNLEEIDSDALFGIDALKNQSINKKIIFFVKVVFDKIYFIVHYLSTLSFSTYLLKIY